MLLTLVLILLLIWAAVVWSIYSNFLVFYSNFSESENYHKAYYSSIAALERAELVIKQRSPWYIWSGWWVLGKMKWEWSESNWWSDGIIKNNKFSYLSNDESTKNTSTVFRNINSRTKRIPAIWNGDVEQMFSYKNPTDSTENSNNFNMMDYNYAQTFLLYYDKAAWNPYKKTKCNDADQPCEQSAPQAITWVIRLPAALRRLPSIENPNFWDLNVNENLIGKWKNDDAVVDWQIRWNFTDENNKYPFTIYAIQTKSTWPTVPYEEDSAIRESHINGTNYNNELKFEFSNSASKRSPTYKNRDTWRRDGQNADLIIISPKENEIKEDLWCNDEWCSSGGHGHKYFENIFTDTDYYDKQLRFSLLNLLKTQDQKIYPFLEYYVEFQAEPGEPDVELSDKYFTIDAEWNYGDYKINKIIWRSTNKESILGSFTSIF